MILEPFIVYRQKKENRISKNKTYTNTHLPCMLYYHHKFFLIFNALTNAFGTQMFYYQPALSFYFVSPFYCLDILCPLGLWPFMTFCLLRWTWVTEDHRFISHVLIPIIWNRFRNANSRSSTSARWVWWSMLLFSRYIPSLIFAERNIENDVWRASSKELFSSFNFYGRFRRLKIDV